MMQSIPFFYSHNPILVYILIVIFSLCIGSFINVIVHRLPKMLNQQWQQACHEFLELDAPQTQPAMAMNLLYPRSQCPSCKETIRFFHNIPIFSFLWLKGKCAYCQLKISWRYPIVELLTALFALACIYGFGLTLQAFYASLLCWALLVLTLIDLEHQILPDNITLTLLWLGLLININATFAPLSSAVIGVIVGYASLWLFMHLFKALTGKQGMGHGDFKLLAALGAWLGWSLIPQIILISSILGAVIGSIDLLLRAKDKQTPIAFGPYLAGAGLIALFFGAELNQVYFDFAGF